MASAHRGFPDRHREKDGTPVAERNRATVAPSPRRTRRPSRWSQDEERRARRPTPPYFSVPDCSTAMPRSDAAGLGRREALDTSGASDLSRHCFSSPLFGRHSLCLWCPSNEVFRHRYHSGSAVSCTVAFASSTANHNGTFWNQLNRGAKEGYVNGYADAMRMSSSNLDPLTTAGELFHWKGSRKIIHQVQAAAPMSGTCARRCGESPRYLVSESKIRRTRCR